MTRPTAGHDDPQMSTETSTDATSLFVATGPDRYRATEISRGPWDPGACHGGPPAALVAGVLETAIADAAPEGVTFFPARVTVELLRPVPVGELTVAATVRRPGKRISVADATVTDADGTVCLAATLAALRVLPFGREVPDVAERPAAPATGVGVRLETATASQVMFARDGVEHRVVAGRFEDSGPATDWLRLTVPILDDRPVTPLERVLAAADFGNGISKWFDMTDVLFLNPDLTVNLHRLPRGEWVCVDAVTRIGPEGVGLAESLLFDEDGPIGRATQSLLVEER